MRCKIFSVPLGSDAALDRERKLNEFLSTTNPKRVFASLANPADGPVWSVLFFYEGDEAPVARSTQPTHIAHTTPANPGAPPDSGAPLSGDQVKWIVALKKWRADQAAQEGVPLYMVAQNKWLEDMVRMPVRTMDDLGKVRGLGEWRAHKYGARILEILNGPNSARRAWPESSYSGGHA